MDFLMQMKFSLKDGLNIMQAEIDKSISTDFVIDEYTDGMIQSFICSSVDNYLFPDAPLRFNFDFFSSSTRSVTYYHKSLTKPPAAQ